jgi:hypothetical protein
MDANFSEEHIAFICRVEVWTVCLGELFYLKMSCTKMIIKAAKTWVMPEFLFRGIEKMKTFSQQKQLPDRRPTE